MITDCYEALEVGDRHATRARTVTETDLVNFAGLTGDWHPLHTDAEFAAADPTFGQRIAHGALVLSLGLGLVTLRPEAVTAWAPWPCSWPAGRRQHERGSPSDGVSCRFRVPAASEAR